MKAIHKFPLFGTPGSQIIMNMPAGAKLLTMQLQGGVPTIWAEVDTDNPMEPRKIATFGTGWELPEEPGQYVGTFQEGPFVWHVYERTGLA
jgi:hypothetical protein